LGLLSRILKRDQQAQTAPKALLRAEMTNSETALIAGVYAALATPRRIDSTEADTAALLEYLDVVTASGVNGLVLFGATGEFVHFDLEERVRVAGLAIKRSRIPVLVNVSHSSLAGAVYLAENAANVGATGLLLMPPYFYRYSEEQIGEFYDRFVQIVEPEIPVLLYNLPACTNPITATLAKRLLTTGALAGIKDSSGDWPYFEALLAFRAQKMFALMVGHEGVFTRGQAGGADGIVSGVSAAFPELIVAIDRAVKSECAERTAYLGSRLEELMVRIDRFPAPVAIKAAAIARGWLSERFALPFDSQTARELSEFRDWFKSWHPVVLAEIRGNVGHA
jgi:dihydrodipicolinate synthase/N-acetylneuraminate lyase